MVDRVVRAHTERMGELGHRHVPAIAHHRAAVSFPSQLHRPTAQPAGTAPCVGTVQTSRHHPILSITRDTIALRRTQVLDGVSHAPQGSAATSGDDDGVFGCFSVSGPVPSTANRGLGWAAARDSSPAVRSRRAAASRKLGQPPVVAGGSGRAGRPRRRRICWRTSDDTPASARACMRRRSSYRFCSFSSRSWSRRCAAVSNC
jgi:hypothetical protein